MHISNLKTVTFVSPVNMETKCTSVVEKMSCLLYWQWSGVPFVSLATLLLESFLVAKANKNFL